MYKERTNRRGPSTAGALFAAGVFLGGPQLDGGKGDAIRPLRKRTSEPGPDQKSRPHQALELGNFALLCARVRALAFKFVRALLQGAQRCVGGNVRAMSHPSLGTGASPLPVEAWRSCVLSAAMLASAVTSAASRSLSAASLS